VKVLQSGVLRSCRAWLGILCLFTQVATHAQTNLPTPLSDVPLYSASNVPANLLLALSVEWPTGVVAAYTDAKLPLVYVDESGARRSIPCSGLNAGWGACYFPAMNYLGYFDYDKCYDYDGTKQYFVPIGTSRTHECEGHWSGNLLNWATMTKLDEFRQVLTGGFRSTDRTDLTVLERARNTGQGGLNSPPPKAVGAAFNVRASTAIGDARLLTSGAVYLRSNPASGELTNCTDPKAAASCSVTDRGIFLQAADNPCFIEGTGKADGQCIGTLHMSQYYVRVQVCVPGMLESNCNAAHAPSDYPGAGQYNKPEGLIQTSHQRMRVGVAAYEHGDGTGQANGALRALLRDNGPTIYNGMAPRSANPTTEWSSSTGIFVTNPAPTDTAISATSAPPESSGAINFLNQFGRVEPKYEVKDNVSELYYVALAYYKHHPLEDAFLKNLPISLSEADGFPAIVRGFNDPVQYTCQGNAIVVLADSHTWYDATVPSSSHANDINNHGALTPLAAAGSDPGLDAGAWAKALGDLPLVESVPAASMNSYVGGSIADRPLVGTPNLLGETYNIAGLAYYAHTQNLRPDLTDAKSDKKGAKVTVDTYVVDVMEPGAFDGSQVHPTYDPSHLSDGHGPNQYWLAAKYGGFSVDDSQCAATSPPLPCVKVVQGDPAHTVTAPTPESVQSWHTNASSVAAQDMRPDNYFPGNRPDLIRSGLATIFDRVTSKQSLSAAAPGISSSRVFSAFEGGVPIYQTAYVPGVWTGDVIGMLESIDANGELTPITTWHAQAAVDTVTSPIVAGSQTIPNPWDTARRIVTYDANRGVGIPFRYDRLSSKEQAAFAGDSNAASPLVDYIRGDRSNEGTAFRTRTHVLGDIVTSGAIVVQGALSPAYLDSANPGYTDFAHRVTTRAPLVFVAANDGMLHAFAGGFSAAAGASNPFADASGTPLGGTEQYAYIPSFVIKGPGDTPSIDGIAAIANLNDATANPFTHHFYVDATPQVADVDFRWSCTTPGTVCAPDSIPDWHTLLVGGLGKGGKGIYALDVTTPPSALDVSNSKDGEAEIGKNVLWEFSDADLGFTYGRPVVAKTRKYGWVVLLTSGYDNTRTGLGYLYVLSARNGALLEKLRTTAGSPARPSGLGPSTPYTQDGSDGTIEQVYAGDLFGNLWRFDLSTTEDYPAPTLFATLQDVGGSAQPITTAPRIEIDLDSTQLGTRRWVFVGTGRLLDLSDLTDSEQQSMYALHDGTLTAPATSGLPLMRADLMQNTDLQTGLAITDSSKGWYYDLRNTAPGGATERVVVDPDAVAGLPIIAWISMVPTGDPCQYAGQQYAVNFGTGRSVLLDPAGAAVPYLSFGQGLTGSEIVQIPSADGPPHFALVGQPLMGSPLILNLDVTFSRDAIGRANWREVLDE